MARQTIHNRRAGRGSTGGGASWISYSDMMAALLLIFVLILTYSLYQYFTMLETKTAELEEQQRLLLTQQTLLNSKEEELDSLKISLDTKQQELDEANAQLLTREQTLALLQAQLAEKESALATAQDKLEEQQIALAEQARRSLAEADVPFDPQPFNPHITLIRKPFVPNDDILAGIRVPGVSMTVRQVCLYRSDHTDAGAKYTVIARGGTGGPVNVSAPTS